MDSKKIAKEMRDYAARLIKAADIIDPPNTTSPARKPRKVTRKRKTPTPKA